MNNVDRIGQKLSQKVKEKSDQIADRMKPKTRRNWGWITDDRGLEARGRKELCDCKEHADHSEADRSRCRENGFDQNDLIDAR